MKLRRIVQVCVCGLALIWTSAVWAQGLTLIDDSPSKSNDTPVSAAKGWNAE